MLDELQIWWQNLTPQTQGAIRDGSLVLAALLGGHFLGTMVARALRARNFDAALRPPGSSPAAEASAGITPTLIAGLLVRLTIWAGAAWWLARQHGRPELASTLGLIINRTWALAAVLVAALGLASLLAHRVMDCLQGLPKGGPEASRNGAGASPRGLAGAVGAGVYGLVVLLALLIAADLFNWPLTRSSALALWQLAHHLLTAGAALLIGWLGARWARELVTPEAATSPEKRAGQYTALGIVAGTTVLAVAVLLSGAGILFGLAALAGLGALLWLVRGHLPDVAAGLQLRAHRVGEVWLDGAPWQVAAVGLLTTEVTRAGEFCRLPNRHVLEARMHGAPAEAGRR
ncbi:MAG TPA: hypothetical protein VNK04_22800 [Gemmataceae bacterium]|nr:hypothetical protein [Gemmataceae bacterium]